ncbi:MAG: sigma-70 family RNA polymerase sigma factor [Rudanella sp.]|nr:sigma-70 family RNA polymerase sigma factor [Rudanella sp.]
MGRNYAFNLMVRKYQQKIYWHIRKMVIDHDDANDLTQETFIKVWSSLENFRGDSQLYTWIYRIATNECLNFLNKKRRRFFLPIGDVEGELMEKLEENADLSTSGGELSGEEIQLKLQKALLKLPDKQRLVFNMKYFDDMKYEEIAAITGTSVGALKASYHLAVKKIEDFLTNSDH